MITPAAPAARPVLLALPEGRYDVADAFWNIFWKDMDAEATVAAVNNLGGPGIFHAIPTTGLDYGARVPVRLR